MRLVALESILLPPPSPSSSRQPRIISTYMIMTTRLTTGHHLTRSTPTAMRSRRSWVRAVSLALALALGVAPVTATAHADADASSNPNRDGATKCTPLQEPVQKPLEPTHGTLGGQNKTIGGNHRSTHTPPFSTPTSNRMPRPAGRLGVQRRSRARVHPKVCPHNRR